MPSSGVQTCADRKSTRLNSSHGSISYAVFCLKKKTKCRSGTFDTARHPATRRHWHDSARVWTLRGSATGGGPGCLCPVKMSQICFFFNDTATTEIYTLSLHDALPI